MNDDTVTLTLTKEEAKNLFQLLCLNCDLKSEFYSPKVVYKLQELVK